MSTQSSSARLDELMMERQYSPLDHTSRNALKSLVTTNKDRSDTLLWVQNCDENDENIENSTTPIECPICMEEIVDLEAGGGGAANYGSLNDFNTAIATTSQKLSCGHHFCRSCLQEHCIHSVSVARVPIPCPDARCDSTLDMPIVQAVLIPEQAMIFAKFQRLHQLKGDSTIVECPHCHSLVQIDANNIPDLICETCHKQFCQIHSTSHAEMSCADYLQSPHGIALTATEHILRQYTQPCSHCQAIIQKSAGCDHIVCLACHQDMCWKCGTHVHLTGKVVRHCSQCQRDYRDHRYDRMYRFRLCLCLPILLPLFLLYVVLASIAAVLTGCFCGFFQCGTCLEFPASSASPPPAPPAPATTRTAGKNTIHNNADARTLANATSNHPSNIKEQNQHRHRGTTRTGVVATVMVVLLPMLLLCEDFGWHCRFLEDFFPETESEMPVMEIVSNTTGSKSCTDAAGTVP